MRDYSMTVRHAIPKAAFLSNSERSAQSNFPGGEKMKK